MLSGQLTQTDIADAERELEELLAGEAERETKLPEAPTHDLPKQEGKIHAKLNYLFFFQLEDSFL